MRSLIRVSMIVSKMFLIIPLLAVFLWIPAASKAEEPTIPFTDELTGIDSSLDRLFVSGKHMVWLQWVEGVQQVFYRNMETGSEKQLTSIRSDKEMPVVSEGKDGSVYVSWLDYRSGGMSVWGMNINDETDKQLSTSISVSPQLSTSGTNVVWSDNYGKVFSYDVVQASEKELGSGKRIKTAKGKALYTNNGDLTLADLSTGKSYQVFVPSDSQQYVIGFAFNGQYVIYEQFTAGDKSKYVLADLSNPIVPKYWDLTKTDKVQEYFPKLYIGDNYAVWSQNNEGQLFGVQLNTRQTFSIDAGVNKENTLFFNGDGLAFKGSDGKVVYRKFQGNNMQTSGQDSSAGGSITMQTIWFPYGIPESAEGIVVQGEDMVWLEPAGTGLSNVRYMNLRTGESKAITREAAPRKDLAVDADYIAWAEYKDEGHNLTYWNIMVYYQKTGRTAIAQMDWSFFAKPAIDKGKLLALFVDEAQIKGSSKPSSSQKQTEYIREFDLISQVRLDEASLARSNEIWAYKTKESYAFNGSYILSKQNTAAGGFEIQMMNAPDSSGNQNSAIVSEGEVQGRPWLGRNIGVWLEKGQDGSTRWAGIRLADGKRFEFEYGSDEQAIGFWNDILILRKGSQLIGKTPEGLMPKEALFQIKQDPILVKMDGEAINFEQQPFIENGTTLVPFRPIFEKLGLKVGWDSETRTITGSNQDFNIQLGIGKQEAIVNGRAIQLAEAPKLVNGNTMVPLRFLGEATRYQVIWDGNLKAVYLVDSAHMGKLYYPDGKLMYEGEMKDGKAHGKGKLYSKEGALLFDAEFVNDRIYGIGTKYMPEEHRVVGELKDGFGNGRTQYILGTGIVWYAGEEKGGLKHGYGTEYSYIDGSIEYEGEWKANHREGKGKTFHDNGNVEYEGAFSKDVPNGQGKLYDKTGKLIFAGEFIDGFPKKK